MKKLMLALSLMALFSACQNSSSGPWADFVACASNDCVVEALAVQDAFVKNPKQMLGEFQKTYAKGEDHVIGWLYILRDSVLLNPNQGKLEERIALQQAIVEAANPFVDDPKLGEMAKSVMDEIGNLALAAETEDEVIEPSSEPITGTYAFDLGGDQANGELQVSQLAYDRFQFKLAVVGNAPARNQGTLEGEAKLEPNNTATFSIKEFGGECSLQFTWTEAGVSLKTLKGDPATCGFGNGVMADGEYKRVKYDDPFFSAKDAANAAKLLGEWQSADDPKAGIKIAEGRYLDLYEGSDPMPAMRYIYYPTCPADCNPAAKTPCLKIIGQDDACFTVVKADGKVLELSQIGGTGNTNRYVKKK
jgi:hypothetical protein